MATRREAREWAVQLLFQLDLNPNDDLGDVFAHFWSGTKGTDRKARGFAEALVKGVRSRIKELDARLAELSKHWNVGRMGVLDRNVIRMALYELLHCPDIPPIVSINEAVDIAKYFSSGESGKFVNGILDQMRRNLDQPAGQAADADG